MTRKKPSGSSDSNSIDLIAAAKSPASPIDCGVSDLRPPVS